MREINEAQSKQLQELRQQVPDLRSNWHGDLGTFRELRGHLEMLEPEEKPETMVKRFLTAYGRLVGPDVPAAEYRTFRSADVSGRMNRLSIQLVLDDLVVIDGRLVADVDQEGVLRRVGSSLPRDVTVTGQAKLNQEDLLTLLRERFMSHPEANEYLQSLRRTGDSTIGVLSVTDVPSAAGPGLFPMTSKPKLVLKKVGAGWHPTWMGLAIQPADLEPEAGPKEWVLTQVEYYVDATNGEFLKSEATIEFADVAVDVQGTTVIWPDGVPVVVNARGIQRDGAERYLKNIDKDIDIITYDADGDGSNLGNRLDNGTMAMSEDADGNWSDTATNCVAADRNDSQQPEIDAHRFATQIYEFYEGLGWKGFDNEGWDSCPVRLVTHVGMSSLAALTGAGFDKYAAAATGNMHGYVEFYDGICDSGDLKYDYFAGELATVAHEYQHAVTYFGVTTSLGDPGQLYGDTIRGAMREGYSDSYAGFISGQWMLRAPTPDGIAVDGDPLRRIEYPRSTDASRTCADHYDEIGDNASKYFKSTILSHAAFLLAQGGIHDRPARAPQYIPVPPIGADASSRIWYRALTQKLELLAAGGGDKRMVEVASYLLEAADELYGTRSKEYVLLRRALFAVGLYPWDTSSTPYVKQTYGGEACMLPWGRLWRRSQPYLALPMFRNYQSLDLFIDNGDGIEYDARIGEENKVFARVRNIGDEDLADVTVEFWYRKAGSALPPEERNWRRCQDAGGTDCTLVLANLPAGGMHFEDTYTDANAVNWYLDPAEISDEVDHFCLRAKILCDAPNHDNDYENYVQSNVHHVLVDSDSDIDTLIAFRAANFHSQKQIPVDLRVEHTLPKGFELEPTVDLGDILLEPGEERTIGYKLRVAGRTIRELWPPFDGEIVGHLYGELYGKFHGNVTDVKFDRRSKRIDCMIAGNLDSIGTITGRLDAELDLTNRAVNGRAIVRFTPFSKEMKAGLRAIGISAKLDPIRVINFTQMVEGKAVGGVTVRLVTKK